MRNSQGVWREFSGRLQTPLEEMMVQCHPDTGTVTIQNTVIYNWILRNITALPAPVSAVVGSGAVGTVIAALAMLYHKNGSLSREFAGVSEAHSQTRRELEEARHETDVAKNEARVEIQRVRNDADTREREERDLSATTISDLHRQRDELRNFFGEERRESSRLREERDEVRSVLEEKRKGELQAARGTRRVAQLPRKSAKREQQAPRGTRRVEQLPRRSAKREQQAACGTR